MEGATSSPINLGKDRLKKIILNLYQLNRNLFRTYGRDFFLYIHEHENENRGTTGTTHSCH